MLPCNFTSENYILIIVFKYNNYDRGMLSDLSVQMETPNLKQRRMINVVQKKLPYQTFFQLFLLLNNFCESKLITISLQT